MAKMAWVAAVEEMRKQKLKELKEEVKRREHYVKTGEWAYNIKKDIKEMKK
jgi:hypothetical protein